MRTLRHALLLSCALLACQRAPAEREQHKSEPVSAGKLRTRPAPAGDLSVVVPREVARERAEGRTLLIYVGADWCEPCQRFHAAAASGQLDAVFPKLSLLELDRDRDEARLAAAGCLSRYIPLFSVPDASGHCSAKQIEGSIKGDGAVAQITPRLLQLLP